MTMIWLATLRSQLLPLGQSEKGSSSSGGLDQAVQAEPLSWDRVLIILTEKLIAWFDGAIALLPNFFFALVILLIGYAFGAVLGRSCKRIFQKAIDSSAVANLFATLVKVGVVTISFFVALELVGLQKAVVSLLAGAGIIGLAIGFAFQDLAENLLAGLLLGIRKPCEPGDLILSNSQFGYVQDLNLRNTIIRNFSGQIIYIPNKEVFKSVLENYSKSGERRIELSVGVSYGEDLEHVTRTLKRAVEGLDFLKTDQDVSVYALKFGESSIHFSVRYWIDFPQGRVGYFAAIDQGVKAIKLLFEEEDILIPFPIRTLDFHAKGGLTLEESLNLHSEGSNNNGS